jgi:hypothetical protein
MPWKVYDLVLNEVIRRGRVLRSRVLTRALGSTSLSSRSKSQYLGQPLPFEGLAG